MHIYATLVGLWHIVALAHVLMIERLVVLSSSVVNPVYVLGQKIVDNPSSPMKIIIPVLYGLHWSAWSITIVCLATLRFREQQRSRSGHEIQEDKRTHSLEDSRDQASISNDPRMRQHLFNFRQSVISPAGGPPGALAHGVGVAASPWSSSSSIGESVMSKTNKGKEPMTRLRSSEIDMPQAPEASWTGKEKRFSSDNNTIFIPNDHRISQVVVTFKDEASEPHQRYTDSEGHEFYLPQQRPADRPLHPEATTVYITHHNYGRGAETGDMRGGVSGGASSSRFGSDKNVYVLNFTTSESLSDMILKSAPAALHPKPVLTMESISPSEQPDTVQRNAKSQERPKEDVPNPARIRATATKVSLTLSSDSSSSETTTSTSATTTDGDDDGQEGAVVNTRPVLGSEDSLVQAQEGVVAGLALVSVTPLSIAHKDHNRHRHQLHASEIPSPEVISEHAPKRVASTVSKGADEDTTRNCVNEPDESAPHMQPNSSDSSPSLSSLSSSSSNSRREDLSAMAGTRIQPLPTSSSSSSPSSASPLPVSSQQPAEPTAMHAPAASSRSVSPSPSPSSFIPATSAATTTPIPPSRSKSGIVSLPLQYWRSRASQSSSHGNNTTNNNDLPGGGPSTSSSSFTQNYLTNTFSKKKKLTIPTIVLHPDEEDGEPARVLSQKDIDYLSTMPPPPLRFLVQPWDDPMEDEYGEEGGYNEGYDYDDDYNSSYSGSPHRPYRPYDEEDDVEDEEDENDDDDDVERRYGARGGRGQAEEEAEEVEKVEKVEVQRGGQAFTTPGVLRDLESDVEQREKNEYARI
ncbi:hypothetical protein BGZ70_005822 [Mortierella alpina]|uniref:Uncharacterized protein n=1 Tax=Mortierella alpina TaxID=64518 RepID=A0A9P6J8D7_MORAP|nr:hypothetical protein BGZ70_005822 [Mortierella alpina]